MHYYVALTSKCNLLCKYCYGKSSEDFLSEDEEKNYDLSLPSEMEYDVETLKNFALKDPNFEITFYGGEPLLRIDKIKEIMDCVPAKTFMLQTNGFFLNKVPKEYLNRFDTILVSIDGVKTHTDERRGIGVYNKIIRNLNLIKSNGFAGEIIARMTVDGKSDVYSNVKFLLETEDFSFDSVHWQLDAQFWKSDYIERDFKTWSILRYNPKISLLVDWWINEMRKGKVWKIYPFLGILDSLISGEKSSLKCGSGFSLLGIQTNGKVTACPITAGFKPFYMGDIKTSSLEEINMNKQYVGNSCLDCDIFDVCGGRCLYANKTKLWGEKGFLEVCDTTFYLVNSLKRIKDEVLFLIKKGIILEEDLYYQKYNGCEIIP